MGVEGAGVEVGGAGGWMGLLMSVWLSKYAGADNDSLPVGTHSLESSQW